MDQQRERPQRWAEAKGGRRWRNPLVVFIWIEWSCEWIAYRLSRWAFISILEHLGRLAIVLALVSWIVEIPERKEAQANQRKAKIFQAWQVITTAQGKPVSGGRDLALRDLIHEGQNLAKVDLSNAILTGADLSGAKLCGADLSAADLTLANLSGARFLEANLSGAILLGANLHKAQLFRADLSGAGLGGADLSGASLMSLRNWRKIRSLSFTNVWDVKNAPFGFLEWAIGEKGAVSIENDDEWKAMVEEGVEWEIGGEHKPVLYDAWKKKWDEEHGDRE